MAIHKDCADHLRAHYRATTGGRLSSGDAHELVAAFFGYNSGAALRAEGAYPVEDLPQADILIPDLAIMALRRQQISGLPTDLADAVILKRPRWLRVTSWLRHFILQAAFRQAVRLDQVVNAVCRNCIRYFEPRGDRLMETDWPF